MNNLDDFKFIISFIKDNSNNIDNYDNGIVLEQLRALWTTFCIHRRIYVDTLIYDNLIFELYDIVILYNKPKGDFNQFDLYMGALMC